MGAGADEENEAKVSMTKTAAVLFLFDHLTVFSSRMLWVTPAFTGCLPGAAAQLEGKHVFYVRKITSSRLNIRTAKARAAAA